MTFELTMSTLDKQMISRLKEVILEMSWLKKQKQKNSDIFV